MKTVSLETAKLLKESGFNKETEYRWVNFKSKKTIMEAKIDIWKVVSEDWDADRLFYAAPIADELLEELPCELKNKDAVLVIQKLLNSHYSVCYEEPQPYEPSIFHHGISRNSLPEAIAEMWLFLKKEGLL